MTRTGSLFRSPLWFVLCALTACVLAYPYARDLVLQPEVTAAARGFRVAQDAGCFGCHGPNGVGGVKNPGSPDGEVPGFAEGTPMMWVNSEQEIREYILDGWPKRKADDPKYAEKIKGQLLFMPAYRGYLSDADVDALVSYIAAMSGLILPEDDAAVDGHDLAYDLGCFDCHGPMGAGGLPNPGSLKGYVPGWWGNDYRDLVRDDDELREWIRTGRLARLEENPIASYFTNNQRIQMPPYQDRISDKQLDALMAYVRWVNQGDWQKRGLQLGH